MSAKPLAGIPEFLGRHRIPLYLLLLLLPLAVAGHNIGVGVVALMLFAEIYVRRAALPLAELWREFRVPLLLQLSFVAVLVLATLLNDTNPAGASGSVFFGHAIWALLPAVVFLAERPLTPKEWQRLFGCLAFVSVVMGGVAVSQNLWGWRLVGASVVGDGFRARGFYSHPLTFAYVGLMLFPLGCAAAVRSPRSVAAWASFLGAAAVVFASQSRTVQAICALVVAFNVFYFAAGRTRLLLVGAAVVALGILAMTDNPVRTRFAETVAPGGHDVRSGYADDRLAFWHANWEMARERPWLGHGDHLNTAYRSTYYARIGLPDFERMYEAHNMYLQIMVNTGFVGLAVFVAWLAWTLRRAAWTARFNFGGKVALQTLAALCAAAVTQNAFQDSEVRYAMTLLCTALWLARPTPKSS